jgi:hypothetical protein
MSGHPSDDPCRRCCDRRRCAGKPMLLGLDSAHAAFKMGVSIVRRFLLREHQINLAIDIPDKPVKVI